MKLKHVILRQPRPLAPTGVPGFEATAKTRTADVAAFGPVIDVRQLTLKEGAEMVASPANDVVAAAPVISLKLIEPVAVAAAQDPLTGGSTWGIKAVGADQAPLRVRISWSRCSIRGSIQHTPLSPA